MPTAFAQPESRLKAKSAWLTSDPVNFSRGGKYSAPNASPATCTCGGGCPRCLSPSAGLNEGSPLPERLQAEFGAQLGTSLNEVRVHTDARAAANADALDANAYTHGKQIVFGEGHYQPETTSGRALLAHELIHVVQQSGDRSTPPRVSSRGHATESEARQGAPVLAAGGNFRPAESGRGLIQREDKKPTETPASSAQSNNYHLELDPQLMAQMRLFFAQWIATQTGTSSLTAPLTPLSSPGGTSGQFTPFVPHYSLIPPLSLTPPVDFTSPSLSSTSSNVFAPIPPDPTFVPPDYSSLYGPYNDRGVSLSGRDRDGPMIDQLYLQRWHLVSALPDLRSWAPPVFRRLIPNTWRRDLASALTGLTVDSALKNDYPTAVEAADAFMLHLTGNKDVVPTYINPPFKPFKWEF